MKKLCLILLSLAACSNLIASEEISNLTDVSNATLLALLYPHNADKTIPELITLDHVHELDRMLRENNSPGNISIAQLRNITGNRHGLNLSKLDVGLHQQGLLLRNSMVRQLLPLLNPMLLYGTNQSLVRSMRKTHVRQFMQQYGHKLPWDELRNTLREHLNRTLSPTIQVATAWAMVHRLSALQYHEQNNDFMQLVRHLLGQPGVDVDTRDPSGRTALHWAAGGVFSRHRNDTKRNHCLRDGRYIYIAAIRMLLAADAQSDIQDQNGDTPLHLAARWGSAEAVRMLLAANANCHLKNQDGQTAFETAAHCTSFSERREIKKHISKARRIRSDVRSMLQAAWEDLPADIIDIILDLTYHEPPVEEREGRFARLKEYAKRFFN